MNCSSLQFLYIYNFNTSKVTTMYSMFSGCTLLQSPDLSSFNTSNVTNMSYMFQGCTVLRRLDLSSFNTSNVTNMSSMFKGCDILSRIYVGNDWSTAAVTSSSNMFLDCLKLIGGQGTAYNANHIDAAYAHTDGGISNPGYFIDINAPQSYACYTTYDKTLTFYYDTKRSSHSQWFKTYDVPLYEYQSTPEWYYYNPNFNPVAVKFDPSFAAVYPRYTNNWFARLDSLETITGLENLNTENVTDMSGMFYGCSSLYGFDLSGFNTSNVTNMSYMFYGCSEYLRDLDLSSFNTENVTDMSNMFYGCDFLYTLNLGSFNTAKVTNMKNMFRDCSSVYTIYVGPGWNTDGVTDTSEESSSENMFLGCSQLRGGQGTRYFSLYADKKYAHVDGGTSNPGYFTAVSGSMSYACYTSSNHTLTFYYDNQWPYRTGKTYGLNAGGNAPTWRTDSTCFDVTKVVFDPSFSNARPTTTRSWFAEMVNLQSITGMEYLNTSEVTNMSFMFYGCSGLNSLDLSRFNTSKVTSMQSMFNTCSRLKSLDLSHFNTANVTNMQYMFYGCSGLTSLDLSSFNTSKVTSMYSMFNSCSGLKSLDLSHFNTANVTTMQYMFYGCSGLTSLDLSSFNTSKVTSMYSMFNSCSGLKSLDLSHFNTANVTTMQYMFYGCSGLTSLNVSQFNTAKVQVMQSMFYNCSGLTSLDLSSFNTAKVTNMSYMFRGCSNLATIYVGSGWNTAAVTSSGYMFYLCTSLVGGMGTTYDANQVDVTYAHIDGGSDNPGYLTAKGTTQPGDVSGDGEIDVNDVTMMISSILNDTPVDLATADMNGDNVVDVLDVTMLIAFILNN